VVNQALEIDKKLANKGRTLIRASGTQPMLRVMVEAQDQDLANQYAKQLVNTVKNI